MPVSQSPHHSCPHCGLPVSGGPHAPYCCNGCRHAHQLLTKLNLERFYDIRGANGIPANGLAEEEVNAQFAWLLPLLDGAESKNGQMRLDLDVQGLHCAACVWLIQSLFEQYPGGLRVDVNPSLGQMSLHFCRGEFDVEGYLTAIAGLGYLTGPRAKEVQADPDGLLLRFGMTGAIAMNGMVFSIAGYLGLDGISDPEIFEAFTWANLILSTISVLIGGPVFFRGAFKSLRRGLLHLDLPISLAIMVAYGGSVFAFFTDPLRDGYFDTLQIFIAFMLLGRLLQQRLVERNRRMLLADTGVSGLYIRRVLPSGEIRLSRAAEVQKDDHLVVAVGEILPVAAEIQNAEAQLALDWINGESDPLVYHQGDVVPAGARNGGQAAIDVRATEAFSSSNLRHLLSNQGQLHDDIRPLSGQFWTRFNTIYVALVLTVATLAFFFWLPEGHEAAINVMVSVLVVTCPCALGLAIPLAYELAHGSLQKSGLFIRRFSFLDRALHIKKVIFDKTGTLTLGVPLITNRQDIGVLNTQERSVLAYMVSRSNHPKSKALHGLLSTMNLAHSGEYVVEIPGVGLRYTDGDSTYALVRDEDPGAIRFEKDGQSRLTIQFEEGLHRDAQREVAGLKALGIDIHILSGDGADKVQVIAEKLSLAPQAIHGGVSPEGKAQFIQTLDENDTLMIGDGINDSLAFEAAYCAGTPCIDRPTLPAKSDFFFMGNGVGPIVQILSMSKLVRRVVLRNLTFAVFYNLVAITLAILGYVTPLVCAVLMPLSSLTVIAMTVASFAQESGRLKQREEQYISTNIEAWGTL